MVTACRVIQGDAASMHPVAIDRAAPGEVLRIEFDLSADADCAGDGVTITNATWSIRTEDDDGLLTLSAPSTAGLVISTQATVDPDETQRNYMITADVTLSDQRRFPRSCSLPVIQTRPLTA